MQKGRGIDAVGTKASFAEAEELEIAYYAGLSWKESATHVETMRRQVWGKNYPDRMERVFRRASLKEDRDDIE